MCKVIVTNYINYVHDKQSAFFECLMDDEGRQFSAPTEFNDLLGASLDTKSATVTA